MIGRLLNLVLIVVAACCVWVATGDAIDYELARQDGALSAGDQASGSSLARVGEWGHHGLLSPSRSSPAESVSGRAAARWPTPEAMRWQPPRGFLRAAFCVHRHESVDWYRAYVDWRGQPSPYSGGMQFLLSTWRRAGGSGHAYQWRPREQVYRAYVIWDKQDGVLGNRRGDWSEFGTAGKCGLR